MAPSSFRATGWDPVLIIAQIISLQTVYYITISILLLFALALTGDELSLDSILDDAEIRSDTVFGWTLALVWLANAVITIPVIVILVQRAKLVLDFVLTLFCIHTMCVWCHTDHFPTCLSWWVLQALSVVCMTLGGEWACMQREMEPILVSQKSKSQEPAVSDPSSIPSSSSSSHQQPSSSLTPLSKVGVDDDGADEGGDWVHLSSATGSSTSKIKRKLSDASKEDAPLTRAVGMAKQVLMQGAQRANMGKNRLYEVIPMKDVADSQ